MGFLWLPIATISGQMDDRSLMVEFYSSIRHRAVYRERNLESTCLLNAGKFGDRVSLILHFLWNVCFSNLLTYLLSHINLEIYFSLNFITYFRFAWWTCLTLKNRTIRHAVPSKSCIEWLCQNERSVHLWPWRLHRPRLSLTMWPFRPLQPHFKPCWLFQQPRKFFCFYVWLS